MAINSKLRQCYRLLQAYKQGRLVSLSENDSELLSFLAERLRTFQRIMVASNSSVADADLEQRGLLDIAVTNFVWRYNETFNCQWNLETIGNIQLEFCSAVRTPADQEFFHIYDA